MTAERLRIFIGDGPRAGEYVTVGLRPGGDLPSEVTLHDPRVRHEEIGTPTSTTYKRIIEEDRVPDQEPDPGQTPHYRTMEPTQ